MSTPDNPAAPDLRAALLEQLNSRLEKIEQRLTSLETPAAPLEPKSFVDHTAPEPAPTINISAPEVHPQIHIPPPVISRTAAFVAATAQPASTPQPTPTLNAIPASAAPTPSQPAKRDNLESRIGKSWTSWVGGIVLLIGILFFVKYAYDQGWLHPSPAARIAAALAGGAILLLFGQWTHAKKMSALAASLSATGLTVLIATFFAAYAAFTPPVLDQPTAFFAVLLTGILGIAFSLYMRQITLTLLAQIGMYISPLILHSSEDKSLSFLLYLGAVTAMSLGVSFVKTRWIPIRIIALCCVWLWLFFWTIFTPLPDHFLLANAALPLCFLLFLAESLFTLHRTPTTIEPRTSTALEALLSILSFANTAAVVLTSAIIYYRTGNADLWIITLGLAGLMALAAFITPSSIFSTAAVIQSIALVVLSVPLYFHHHGVTIAWAIFALALAIFAALRNNLLARVWSLILLLLVGMSIAADSDLPGFLTPLFTLGNQPINLCFLYTLAAALLALLCAYLNRPRLLPNDDGTFAKTGADWYLLVCTGFASLLALIAGFSSLQSGSPLTLHLLLWSLVLLGFLRLLLAAEARVIDIIALAILLLAAVKWLLIDALIPMTGGLTDNSTIPLPGLLFTLNALLLTAAYFLSPTLRTLPATRAWLTTATLFALVNIELLRSIDAGLAAPLAPLASQWIIKNVALSILWGLTGVGFILTGFKIKKPPVRWVGLALLGVTVSKVLLIDMADVQTILRVASFLLLGILLLAVSYLYHRIAQKPAPQPHKPHPAGCGL